MSGRLLSVPWTPPPPHSAPGSWSGCSRLHRCHRGRSGHAVSDQIDPERPVLVDRVADDGVVRACLTNQHANRRVERNLVCLAGDDATDPVGRGRAVNVDADLNADPVAERAGAGGIDADEVARTRIGGGSAGEADARLVVARDDVPVAGAWATIAFASPMTSTPASVLPTSTGPEVSSDQVADDDVAERGSPICTPFVLPEMTLFSPTPSSANRVAGRQDQDAVAVAERRLAVGPVPSQLPTMTLLRRPGERCRCPCIYR